MKFIIFLTLAVLTTVKGQGRCPLIDISPCDCTNPVLPPVTPATVTCGLNEDYTQEHINEAIRAYRVANGALVPSQKIYLYRFILYEPLTSPFLDLTKFANMEFDTVELRGTGQGIIGGTNSTEEVDIEPFRFSVDFLETSYGEMTDEKTAVLLKFVQPQNLTELWLWYNDLTVVPDLSPFINLRAVLLARTKITKVSGGQFRNLGRMDTIALDNMNINEIGEDGLLIERREEDGNLFVPCNAEFYPYPCEIRLYHNNLTEGSIHVNHGFESWLGPTELSLDFNHIEFISQEKFEKFLTAHPENILTLTSNPIVCDERAKWLKDKREEYEHRVEADCANDPGKTVFTSDLIP